MEAPGRLCARTKEAEYRFPQDCEALFGAKHPFIDSLGEDLLRLCEHPDAGDFVLLGWRDGITPLTFAEENGGHAGATPEETNGFALLPADAPLAEHQHACLRPTDLRKARCSICQSRNAKLSQHLNLELPRQRTLFVS
jgi:hypothetical protein